VEEDTMTRHPYSLIMLVLFAFLLAGSYQMAMADSAKDKALDAKITTSVKAHLAKNDSLKTLTQISVKTVD
jgi:hypothetical protein